MTFWKSIAVGLLAAAIVEGTAGSAAAFPLNLVAAEAVAAPTGSHDSRTGDPDEENRDTSGSRRAKKAKVASDNFETARTVDSVPFVDAQDTTGATLQAGEPQACTTTSTVWYSFRADRAMDVTAVVSGDFAPVVAVYTGAALDALEAVGCTTDDGSAAISFGADAGQTYHLQIGSSDGRVGEVEVDLDLAEPATPLFGEPGPLKAGWDEEVLLDRNVVVTQQGEGVSYPLARIDGRPSEDGEYYRLSVGVADTELPEIAVYTAGKVRHEIHEELVTLLDEGTDVRLVVSRRFATSETQCAAYAGGVCAATVPVDPDDPNWVLDGGRGAELIVRIQARVEGALAAHTLRLPLVGQVGTLVP